MADTTNSWNLEQVCHKRIDPAHFLCLTLQRNAISLNGQQFHENKAIEVNETLTIDLGMYVSLTK